MTEPTPTRSREGTRGSIYYVPKRGMALGTVAPRSQICMSAPRNPREGGLGVECQERKREGGGRTFQALEEVERFRSRRKRRQSWRSRRRPFRRSRSRAAHRL